MSAPDYIVVTAADIAALQTAVNAKLLEGYAVYGNAAVGGSGFIQSMAKNAGGTAGPFVAEYPITAVTTGAAGAAAFTVAGDQTSNFTAGYKFQVAGTHNPGVYRVRAGGSTFGGGNTVIPVVEAVSAGTAGDSLIGYAP